MMNNSDVKNITNEQLDKILNWLDPIAREQRIRIGLIGGEPTLHPDFINIINPTINNNICKNIFYYTSFAIYIIISY